MADERVDSEIVTQFFLNTCRLCPRLTEHAVQAAQHCAYIATGYPVDDSEVHLIPLTTGSAAEFYIEPMLPCVGDIDVMSYGTNRLAIPQGHPPPTQLPAEFHDYVQVHEIIDSHLPGYVYLNVRYLLTYCPEDEKYNYVEYDEEAYVGVKLDSYVVYNQEAYALSDDSQRTGQEFVRKHGPARQTVYGHPSLLSRDAVACTRCLLWPPQAADWSIPHRNYDWPDSSTVDRVVNNGCDVVLVAHHQCRQDQWMSIMQHRLSFSRAEIVLINSWMPVQQIVYHMLRVFMKTEQLTDSADNTGTNILSNYHIKTLMLWACELKPRSWWTDGLNLVKICVKLMHTLFVWLNDRRCQHYFINNCNLIDTTLSVEMVVSELRLNDMYLSLWFVENYIERCARFCGNVDTNANLQNRITAIVIWRVLGSLCESWKAYQNSRCSIAVGAPRFSFTLRSLTCLKTQLEKMDESLTVYLTAVTFLQASRRILRNNFTDELMDVVTSVLGHYFDIPRKYNQRSSVLSLRQAAKLMKVCLLYTSPSPRDGLLSRMPSSA